ncbi:ribonuclease P protein component 3 [Methanosarcinales archaeon ex4572_44]|nr:MAG: ribonuclease P protein component 3 [Methanosarcinales archaeon ex4484_138]PHP45968.1 MAG: ribonuclease P protein component 3 [Methanosarcinales archaeon ex4572_44]RLG26320.1 MAG: ribonuclease P protein component 3 [Methanosarcinales archaeon]RLG28361.1 MAG: ribonuclease P protein component 3 [Methanosarcinales archaeon]
MSLFTSNSFYELCMKPESREDLHQMAGVARRYRYAGVAVPIDMGVGDLDDLPTGFSIIQSVELVVKNASRVSGTVKQWWEKSDCLILRGGSESLNRVGVESQLVDVLSSPGRINHVLAKLASENGVAIEFNLGAIIHTRGQKRSETLALYRNNLKLLRKYRAPFILTTTPRTSYDLRAPREMAALSMLFGMTREETVHGLSTVPSQILEKHDPNFIADGVRLV